MLMLVMVKRKKTLTYFIHNPPVGIAPHIHMCTNQHIHAYTYIPSAYTYIYVQVGVSACDMGVDVPVIK